MAGHESKGAPATERVDIERVLSRRDQVVTLLGRDPESGGTWVIKELHLPVRRSRPRISSAPFGLGWCCPGGWNAKAPEHG